MVNIFFSKNNGVHFLHYQSQMFSKHSKYKLVIDKKLGFKLYF